MRNSKRLITIASCPIQHPSGVNQMIHYQVEKVNNRDEIFSTLFKTFFNYLLDLKQPFGSLNYNVMSNQMNILTEHSNSARPL